MLLVEIKTDGTRETIGKGVVIDMSSGGFRIETEAVLQEGGKYRCLFEIPIEYMGQVAWNSSQGQMRQYGIKFSDFSFIDKFLLKKFLKGPRKNRRL